MNIKETFTEYFANNPQVRTAWDSHCADLRSCGFLPETEELMIMGCFIYAFNQGYKLAVDEFTKELKKNG